MIISFLFFEKGVNITRFFPQLNNSFDLIYNINKWKTLQILEMLSSSSLIFFSIKICWPWLLFGGGGVKIPGFSMLQKHYSIQKMQYALNFNPLNCLTGHFKTKNSFENIDTKKSPNLNESICPWNTHIFF